MLELPAKTMPCEDTGDAQGDGFRGSFYETVDTAETDHGRQQDGDDNGARLAR